MNANMFTRARLQLPLSPAERSFLKFLQGAVVTVLVAAVTAGLPFLEQQSVDWRTVATITAGTFVATLASMIQKYFSAQGDGPLAGLAGAVATAVSSADAPPPPAAPSNAVPVPASNI